MPTIKRKTPPKTTVVYKIVSLARFGTKLVSGFTFASGVELEYKTGEFTKPAFGKIFAFQTRQQAIDYCSSRYKRRLYKALATGVRPVRTRMLDATYESEDYYRWWQTKRGGVQNPPRGTVTCTSLKLQEEVGWYD